MYTHIPALKCLVSKDLCSLYFCQVGSNLSLVWIFFSDFVLFRAEALKSRDTALSGLPVPPSNLPQETEETIPDLPLPPKGPFPSFDDDSEDEVQPSSSSTQSTSSNRLMNKSPNPGTMDAEGGEPTGGRGGGGPGGGGGGGGKYTADELLVLRYWLHLISSPQSNFIFINFLVFLVYIFSL